MAKKTDGKTEQELDGEELQGTADDAEKLDNEEDLDNPPERPDPKVIQLGPMDVHNGKPGDPFQITRDDNGEFGGGFGARLGTLIIDGVIVQPTSWQDWSIKGVLPKRCRLGSKVTVDVADGLTRYEGRIRKSAAAKKK